MRKKRCLALLLVFAMLFTMTGLTPVTFAADAQQCPNHTQHDESCDCHEAVPMAECVHTHDMGCGYIEAAAGTPCGHQHNEACGQPDENGDYPDCLHVHDVDCGYTPDIKGYTCTHTCSLCLPQGEGIVGETTDGALEEAPNEPLPFSIVTQPFDQTATQGQGVTFTVSAQGEELSYQWQRSTMMEDPNAFSREDISDPNTLTWDNIPGASTQTLTFDATLEDLFERFYRCQVTSGQGEGAQVLYTQIVVASEPTPEKARNGTYTQLAMEGVNVEVTKKAPSADGGGMGFTHDKRLEKRRFLLPEGGEYTVSGYWQDCDVLIMIVPNEYAEKQNVPTTIRLKGVDLVTKNTGYALSTIVIGDGCTQDTYLVLMEGTVNTIRNENTGGGIVNESSGTLYVQGSGSLIGESRGRVIGGHPNKNKEFKVVIQGGIINAKGGGYDAAIGSYVACNNTPVTINGGTIFADSRSDADGMGAGWGWSGDKKDLVITGGSVRAINASGITIQNSQVVNSSGTQVYPVTLSLGGENVANLPITKLMNGSQEISYGLTDVQTDAEGKLYFWLPAGTVITSVTANSGGRDIQFSTSGFTVKAEENYVDLYESGWYGIRSQVTGGDGNTAVIISNKSDKPSSDTAIFMGRKGQECRAVVRDIPDGKTLQGLYLLKDGESIPADGPYTIDSTVFSIEYVDGEYQYVFSLPEANVTLHAVLDTEEAGDFTVTSPTGSYEFKKGVLWLQAGHSYTVAMKEGVAQTGQGITVKASDGATGWEDTQVTLDNVNIQSLATAFVIPDYQNVKILLKGENTLKAGTGQAGVNVRGGGKVTITSASGDDSPEGILNARGGAIGGGYGGAGIGGNANEDSGEIVIAGGTISASGAVSKNVGGGAGIGLGTSGLNMGDITITGGIVKADGSSFVYDRAQQNSAAIGDGARPWIKKKLTGTITIAGGTVTAKRCLDSFMSSEEDDIGTGCPIVDVSELKIIITGGALFTERFSVTPQNSNNMPVYRTEFNFGEKNTLVTISDFSPTYYNVDTLLQTDENGRLYFYLPEGNASCMSGGSHYLAVVENTNESFFDKESPPPTGTAPSITQQPTGQAVTEGQTATFSVAADGNPAPSYQWEVNQGSGWNAITGATRASYTTAEVTAAMNGWQYRCVATNTEDSATSNAATLTVHTALATNHTIKASADTGGSISPSGSVDVQNGGNQTFKITVEDGYEIDDVKVDGVSVGITDSYTFTNVTAPHTIQASFRYIGGGGTDPAPHTHIYGNEWKSDALHHWYECTAGDGAKSQVATHTAGDWITVQQPTETEAGSRRRECTVCGYIMQIETIAPTGPSHEHRTLTDPATGIRVSGYFTADAALEVKEMLLHVKGDCGVCDDIRARQEKGELVVLYDIRLASGSYTGDLTVEIPVGSEYNGQTVLVLHCKDKVLESRTLTVENGVVKGMFSSLSPYAVAKMPGGNGGGDATAITGLPGDCTLLVNGSVSWPPSPVGGTWSYDKNYLQMIQSGDTYNFKALKAGKTTATYTTADGVPHTVNITINTSTIPQTGDDSNLLPFLLLALAALVGCVALLLDKRRYTKRHG